MIDKFIAPGNKGTNFESAVRWGVSVQGVCDTQGNILNPNVLTQTLGYNGSNQLTTITATDGTNTWVQTLTYSGTNLLNISGWVKQ